jgi:hypothetical protein
MKKALALSAFALVMTLPLVGSAGSITNSFLRSSSGASTIGVGDTITYEVSITTVSARIYDTMLFSLSGDAASAVGDGIPWSNTNNLVTAWNWNYKSGGVNTVKFGTNGLILPANNASITTLPTPVSIGYGWFGIGAKTGTGATNLLGTVTITANTSGNFEGGGFFLPNVDGPVNGGITYGDAIATAASFTVVPEPGTALLMVLGLGGLGIMGRKSRE